MIYGTRKYHYDRLTELSNRGLIRRCGKYNEITAMGMKEAGSGLKPIKITKEWAREHKARLSQVYIGLGIHQENYGAWSFISSRDFKIKKRMVMSSKVDGCLVINGEEYAVYLLGDEPSKSSLNIIKTELNNLYIYRVAKVIVFYPTLKALKSFESQVDSKKLSELLLIRYPEEIHLLKYMDEIKQNLTSRLKDYKPTGRPFADFERGRTYVSIMIFNDLVKKKHLLDYMNHVMAEEGREVIILCLEEQFNEMESLYPAAKEILRVRRFWGDTNVKAQGTV
ncbi:MAG: hypothetical protein A4E53_01556 [Pelotomaculum sp. PtaB.Bin104]|nr:MAG: hypothetical protein A4E53_01556 [Pelotomaculum sp. PtaB.Bin104]